MACPYCGCKVHYQYTEGDAYASADDEGHERCAACGEDFYLDDAADEDEEDA